VDLATASKTLSEGKPLAAERSAAVQRSSLAWLRRRDSLARRLFLLAAAWIIPLILIGGFTLDRVVSANLTSSFDSRLQQYLSSMIGAAEVDESGEVRFTRALGDQRFFEPYSGLYWQVSSPGVAPFHSRSLWDRTLPIDWKVAAFQQQSQTVPAFEGAERLRMLSRDILLPGSDKVYRFVVAQTVEELEAQISALRSTLTWSLGLLGFGLLALAAVQSTIGLKPLVTIRRALTDIRSGTAQRLQGTYPPEIQPLVDEMNALLLHNEEASEQARTHAGNLAHALKTPMAVLLNEARDSKGKLAATVSTQTMLMKRHVDHHLARARAVGRRSAISARAPVWGSIESLKRALERIYAEKAVAIMLVGDRDAAFRGERQDLEEMLGNLMDNACKYGGDKVQVTVAIVAGAEGDPMLDIVVEDNGKGIAAEDRERLFGRGVRLDQSQPGTGLGLAIVRDIAEICGGSVSLDASEALGGLLVRVQLPAVDAL
jgi:signal transduction histidine kinase